MKLTPHFTSEEFECHCNECYITLPPCMLLAVLEDVRSNFGKPVTIMSGYRCLAHNTNVGGSTGSKHMEGIAADIMVSDTSPSEVHSYLVSKYSDTFGIGKYDTFTHVDVRENKGRW